jgi:hypothetical protein
LSIQDEAALLRLEEDLKLAGIPHRAIREPDAPYNGALMAIGIQPTPRVKLRPLLQSLELIK